MMLPDNAAFLDEVVDAILQHNPVAMTYRRFNGTAEELRIRPLSIAVYDHQLYIIGRDNEDVDHPFRFSRITNVEREATTFEYPSKADYDPNRLFLDSFGIFIGADVDVQEIELKLQPKWATFASCHRWHRSQKVVRRDDHVMVRMRVRLCPELKAWILGFGADAEVISPPGLRDDIRRSVAAMAMVYRAQAKAK
jgi:proteasome accessory factor B